MKTKKQYSILVLFLVIVLCANLISVQVVRADGEPPTEPPTQPAVVESTSVPIDATAVPDEATAVPTDPATEAAPSQEAVVDQGSPSPVVLPQALENTDIVVLDDQGQALALGSQETADALVGSDPVWCPESVSVPTPGANGCSVSYLGIAALLAAMQADPQSFSQNGTIFLEKTNGAGFTTPLVLDDSTESLGGSFNSLNLYNLTVQGGWNPATGTTSDQTTFSGATGYIQVGSLANPWVGSLVLNNLTVNGAGTDGIQVFASNVALTNVNASYNDGNGISIKANKPGTVTLGNVVANGNGHVEGSEPVGSGVYINGSDTLVNIFGGSFNNNARYGIEALNSTSNTIPIANSWTDQGDYVPGSVVTISGNDNSLNGNKIGFIPGETVLVSVQGPHGYVANCQAVANAYGGWSCQITLWANDLAVGDYSYTAVGLTSAVSVTSTFKDARTVDSATVNGGTTVTVAPGGTINVTVNVTTTSGSNTNWHATGWRIGNSGAYTCVNTPDHNGASSYSESFAITAPATPGTYDISFIAYQDNGCGAQGASAPFTLSGGVTVTSPTNTPTKTPTSAPTNTPTNTPTSTPTNIPGTTPTNTPISVATNVPTNTPIVSGPTSQSSTSPSSQSSSNSAFIIPLTGGELIKLDCNSVFWAFGIKLTFFNLCDQQTTVHSVGTSDLPGQLPAGFSFVRGLKIDILTDGQVIQDLPDGAGIETDFPLYQQLPDHSAVLYWNGSQWIEISQQISKDKISQTLGVTAPDELYQLIQSTTQVFYPTLTTDKTGIFVLVQK